MFRDLRLSLAALCAAVTLGLSGPALADTTPQTLPFSQSWGSAALITANDNWNGVPGIQGFLGQDITTATGTDPQTLTGESALANDLDVIANQSNPGITNGGVGEFDGIANPTVALQGSGTADAPYLLIHLNTTGQSGITVSYNLRDIDASTDNSVQPVALQYRVGSTGAFTNLPAGFVADASSGPSLATLVTPVSVALPAAANNQPLVQIRIMTTNAVGTDEWIGVDDILVTAGPSLPALTINDPSVTEGDGGTVTAFFTVSLSAPAGPGGVTFDIATQDNTATTADNDYVASSLTGQTIPAGSSTFAFGVTVNGDTTVEPNQTFFVNVTNVVGANVADGQGTGTINNDDVTITPIHDIQGPGASSPIVGATVSTRGIVTGVKSNGFFIQEPDASVDADPATSEGILVFTSSAPPAAAMVGNFVQVTGTVTEFVPNQDPFQPPLTEITSPAVTLLSAGNPLPAPVALTPSFPDPAGPFDQLERLEGMVVSVESFTVTGPTLGSISEASATATSNGVFYGVVTGVGRPFREAGVQLPDPLPAGSPCCVPRFDTNPERLRVDSDGQLGGTALDVSTGAIVTGLVGPLDYTFRTYTIQPDPASPLSAEGGLTPLPVTPAAADEFTVATYNLQRFYDTVDDGGTSDVVLTAAAFDARLDKASLAIRNFLGAPDILGVVEAENLSVLQSLAARVSADAIAAGQPDPQYDAFLVEGNDIGGIDVGFLVKTAPVVGATPRVTVLSVTQEGDAATYVNPNNGASELLNDRPPLVLEAEVNDEDGASFPVTVIVNHLRSLNDVDNPDPNGTGTVGARVRAKRRAQAEFLANLVQARQTADPTEAIVLVGDFNAFPESDGYVDSMGTIQGTPAPANQVVLASADLVEPNLVNLLATEPDFARYSYVFDGNAQTLDHVLVNAGLIDATVARRLEHARINADFPEVARNDAASAVRLSDHDPAVAFFQVAAFGESDLSVAKQAAVDPVFLGGLQTYTISVTNDGPSPAQNVVLTDMLPAGTTLESLTPETGWSCPLPPVIGSVTTITCTIDTFLPGTAIFSFTVRVGTGLAVPGTITNTVTVISDTVDPNPGMETATVVTAVQAPPAVTASKAVSGTFTVGSTITYTIVISNTGSVPQGDNAGPELTDVLPAQLQVTGATATAGTATVDAGTNTVTWNGSIPAAGSVTITIQATILPDTAGQTVSNQATIAFDADGNGTNESSGTTQDTRTGGPTRFAVQGPGIAEIPTLSEVGLALLVMALALLGTAMMRRRAAGGLR